MTVLAAPPAVSAGALEERLLALKLVASPFGRKAIDTVLDKLRDVLPNGQMGVMLAETIKGEEEVLVWDCFATVFSSEVDLQVKQSGAMPDAELMRQILADILVWQEFSSETFDKSTAAFMVQFHQADSSFQRIGRLLDEAKADQAQIRLADTTARCAGISLQCR